MYLFHKSNEAATEFIIQSRMYNITVHNNKQEDCLNEHIPNLLSTLLVETHYRIRFQYYMWTVINQEKGLSIIK